jgi:hypothetical protein
VVSDRWGRLVASLAADGITAKADRQSESYSISIRTGDVWVEIHDKWWSKNTDVWIGWQVHTETADSIVRNVWPLTKKRGQVVADVREAVGAYVA